LQIEYWEIETSLSVVVMRTTLHLCHWG
jgi:hypothetical protein